MLGNLIILITLVAHSTLQLLDDVTEKRQGGYHTLYHPGMGGGGGLLQRKEGTLNRSYNGLSMNLVHGSCLHPLPNEDDMAIRSLNHNTNTHELFWVFLKVRTRFSLNKNSGISIIPSLFFQV